MCYRFRWHICIISVKHDEKQEKFFSFSHSLNHSLTINLSSEFFVVRLLIRLLILILFSASFLTPKNFQFLHIILTSYPSLDRICTSSFPPSSFLPKKNFFSYRNLVRKMRNFMKKKNIFFLFLLFSNKLPL